MSVSAKIKRSGRDGLGVLFQNCCKTLLKLFCLSLFHFVARRVQRGDCMGANKVAQNIQETYVLTYEQTTALLFFCHNCCSIVQ